MSRSFHNDKESSRELRKMQGKKHTERVAFLKELSRIRERPIKVKPYERNKRKEADLWMNRYHD